MHVVVVQALSESTVEHLALAAHRSAEAAGHTVSRIDLAGDRFQPWMTAAERAAYEGDEPLVDPLATGYARAVLSADVIVLVDRSQMSTMSPMLKGWMEKVFVPGVAFVLDERTHRVKRGLTGVRRVIGINVADGLGHGGRTTVMRALRLCTGWRTRATWLELGVDGDQAALVRRIERRMGSL